MLRSTAVVVLVLVAPCAATAAETKVALATEGWELSGAGSRVERFLGAEALRLGTGRAIRRDVRFQDGTIEFDVAVTERVAFVGLQFRIQSDVEYEMVWFRTHKSGLPDAIQYSPIWQGASSWQLYHGPGYTGDAQLPRGEWIHVRLVLSGTRAALFVGPGREPQLVIPRLARETQPGYIALDSLRGRGVPEGVYVASYANLVLRPGEVDVDFSKYPITESTPSGIVRRWHVSPAFVPGAGAVRELPQGLPEPARWSEVPAEPEGFVALLRHVAIPKEIRVAGSIGTRPATLARVTVRAAEAGTRRFNLGYSDEASVFLNGQLLFSGNSSYSGNFPRRQGLITLDQASLYLPLRAGDNELIVAVSEVFGGWGLMGQFEDGRGLEVF